MARITQELAVALPTLSKAVFSQPANKTTAPKVEIRPLILKGERVYQAERFENNKAFHENLKEDSLLSWAAENLEGKYRQAKALCGYRGRTGGNRDQQTVLYR